MACGPPSRGRRAAVTELGPPVRRAGPGPARPAPRAAGAADPRLARGGAPRRSWTTPASAAAGGALARLYPPAFPDDPEAEAAYADLVLADLVDTRRERVAIVEATLDAEALDDAQAAAWLGTLNDLRLVLGSSLGIEDGDDAWIGRPGRPGRPGRDARGGLRLPRLAGGARSSTRSPMRCPGSPTRWPETRACTASGRTAARIRPRYAACATIGAMPAATAKRVRLDQLLVERGSRAHALPGAGARARGAGAGGRGRRRPPRPQGGRPRRP